MVNLTVTGTTDNQTDKENKKFQLIHVKTSNLFQFRTC